MKRIPFGYRAQHRPASTPPDSSYEAGSGPAERHRLRHWLSSKGTWEVLAGARLTHPRWVVAAARRHGLRPHWQGRVRVWSWPELQRLAQLETARRDRIAAAIALQLVAQEVEP